MRRPVGVKLVLDGFCGSLVFFASRAATVATLPSALFDERFVRSVQVGCSRFSRCCHLIIDLSSISRWKWARRLSQSPELGVGLCLSFFVDILNYAATGIVLRLWFRKGSYTSALTHSRCNYTANFRATATMARFFPFFPPRSASFSPQRRKSLSAPNGPRMWCAPCA